MTQKEYLEVISNLDIEIYDKSEYEQVLKSLKEIFLIKPIRLEWFTTKAELMLDLGNDMVEISNMMNGKFWALYNYRGIIKSYKIFLKLAEKRNDTIDYKRFQNLINVIISNYSNDDEEIEDSCKWLNDNKEKEILIKQEYIKRHYSIIGKLVDGYYIKQNYIPYLILQLMCKNIDNMEKHTIRSWITKISNIGYLIERIVEDNKDLFIVLINNFEDKLDCEIIVNALYRLRKKVILIDIPLKVEIENEIFLKDTLSTSIDNIEEYQDKKVIHPIELICNGKSIGDNREYIIDYICKEFAENNLATVLCSGNLIDDLCMRPLMKKQMERLSSFQADYLEDNMAFGWVGKYTSYTSRIYNFDVESEINKPTECKFSIIVPARNSASSLRHTLETCLNQRYKGSYEIVLSDNSTNGNTEVYDLYRELNNPRIKYYKTPRDLHLPKSFEFAFLKAKGDFIISIGSDDALLPWTLEVLSDVLKKYPEEEIFQWERGFYAWPGFNGGQENQFTIPSKYEKNEYNVYNVNKNDYWAMILSDPQCMYSLPLLYINSGFRRSYFNTLLNKTGRLWDGICQDIYMGVINISINEHITNIKYPLTIAGMTGASIGAKSNSGATSVKESNARVEENIKTNNIGGFSTSYIERLMPEVTTDISSLYNSILRAVSRGVLPIDFLDNLLDWKQMFMNCFMQLDIRDVLFDKKLHYFQYTASKHGEEFLKWFDENIYENAIIPRKIDEKVTENILKKKTYVEGAIETGGQILDASKYGVTNVYEASLLFEKLTEL